MASDVIGEFVRALRAAQLPVSTAETLDAMRTVELIGYADRHRLRAGLGAVLAKSEAHRRLFDVCFDRFFVAHDASEKQEDGASASSTPESQPPGDDPSASGGGNLPGQMQLSPLSESLMAQDETALAAAMARAGAQTGTASIRVITQKGLFGRRLYLAMGGEEVDRDIAALEQQAEVLSQQQANRLRQARDGLRGQIRGYIARQFLLHGAAHGRELREQVMREVALRDLREFRDVSSVIRKMARKLVAVNSRRLRRQKRGLLDARKTVVASIGTDAVPWRVSWRSRRRLKPRLLVVCDVSNSVSAAAGFLMMFLAAVREVLPETRTFVFASRFAEVTDRLSGNVDEAQVRDILDQWGGAGTDYAGMFEDLLATCGSHINRRTTVLFLGDARNNEMPPGQGVLKEIANACAAVLWLNPEPMSRWDSGDSVMSAYSPYCRHMASCSSLAQLERFVSVLLADMRRH